MAETSPTGPVRALLSRAIHAGLAAGWWVGGVRVLLTSVPKCGTHLVRRLLDVVGLPTRCEVPWDIAPASLAETLRQHRGSAVVGHLPSFPARLACVDSAGVRALFISRDPRDQVVSHLHYVRANAAHPVHPYLRDCFPDDDEALLAIIHGVRFSEAASLPDVDTLFRGCLEWRTLGAVYSTTFERLIGPRGGGSESAQAQEVAAMLRHIGFPLRTRSAVAVMAHRLFSVASPTFRIGRIGGWRGAFKPRHVDTFKQVAGSLLVDLGYERDLDW
jgi:hypothetical protein